MVIVNGAMILTYYQIGVIINERKSWGNKYIQRLAIDLKEYGNGYSYEQLSDRSRRANIFTKNEIIGQPVLQIPWGTIVKIMKKSSSKEEMLWYIYQTHRNRWSRLNSSIIQKPRLINRGFKLSKWKPTREMIQMYTPSGIHVHPSIKDVHPFQIDFYRFKNAGISSPFLPL